jgi:formylglycine-generating enzyme required for sulfatase activity
VWTLPTCSGTQLGASNDNWGPTDNGDWTDSGDLYACSIEGVTPSGYMTWFQAQQSCRAAGKTLCTNAEWQAAALGTPDPHSENPGAGIAPCNIWSGTLPAGASSWATYEETTLTGSATGCVSYTGAHDMVGNVDEWVADWLVGGMTWMVSDLSDQDPWPSEYNGDYTWNVNGAAMFGDEMIDGLPAGVRRGGSWHGGRAAGAYTEALDRPPSYSAGSFGARCCKRN